MKLLSLITGALLLTVSCSQMPLKKVPLGGSIHSYIVHERKQEVDYLSIRQTGGTPINIANHPVFDLGMLSPNWKILVSTRLKELEAVEVNDIDSWARKYEQAMNIVADNIRDSSYELTIIPSALTYRSLLRKEYTKNLVPISFVFSIPDDYSVLEAFQRIFRTLSHEQYHIYQKLDIDDAPIDRISSEAFATFVSGCVSNIVFSNLRDPGKNIPSIGDYILDKPTLDELRKSIAVNAETNDLIQNNLAGKLVVRYLFDIMMEKPTKEPAKFSAELNKLCRQFGANTPTTWEGLLDLYTTTGSNNDH